MPTTEEKKNIADTDTSTESHSESAPPRSAEVVPLPAQQARVTPPLSLGYRIGSRTLDIVVSAIGLIVAAPLLLVIAVMIKLDSPGPVFFRHVRVGFNRRRRDDPNYDGPERRSENRYGEPFTIFKFRTMYADARERFPEHYQFLEYNEEKLRDLPMKLVKASNFEAGEDELHDPRLTRVGRWLRRTSLDELPNLINVLRGDMALVGPRPDIAENFARYLPEHSQKGDAKPGVTGLAQVMGRNNLSFHEINAYDVEYINTRTLWMDIKILFRTVAVVIKREGAF